MNLLGNTKGKACGNQSTEVLYDSGEGHNSSPAHSNDANVIGRSFNETKDSVAWNLWETHASVSATVKASVKSYLPKMM